MKTLRFLVLSLLVICFSLKYAQAFPHEIYQEQYALSGADKIKENIPANSYEILKNMGISEGSWKEISSLNLEKIFAQIIKILNEKFTLPFKSLLPVISIMLVCSMIRSLKPEIIENHMNQILNSMATLCICMFMINPIIHSINSAALVIDSASNFILCFVPIMSSIMLASGHAISAASYHTLVIFAGQTIFYFSKTIILPLMSILLGISVVSSLSIGIQVEPLCRGVHKFIKTILEFTSSIFTSILALQSLVSSSADGIGTSALKFALNSCVPIVGGMVSDAFSTVQGCVKLLKSGVGAFGIITGGIIFLPAIIECLLWVAFLNLSSSVGETLKLKEISLLLKSVSNVMSTLNAILIFSIIILLVSSGVMLVLGGK